MTNFEASISTSDQKVRLVAFNMPNNTIMSQIDVSGVPLFFSDVTRLSAIADCLVKSKQEIDRIKLF